MARRARIEISGAWKLERRRFSDRYHRFPLAVERKGKLAGVFTAARRKP